jgi:hypothetical protein
LAVRLSARPQRSWFAASFGATLLISWTCGQAFPSDGIAYAVDDDVQRPYATELWETWSDNVDLFWSEPPGPLVLTVDYRFRTLYNSTMTDEFATIDLPPSKWAPTTQQSFPINSVWHGFQIGLEQADCAAHFEWMTPQKANPGNYSDFGWQMPDHEFTDMGYAQQRWTEGQMLDLGYEFRLFERLFDLPFEVWPAIGFRWQRFNLTCHDEVQFKYANQWLDPPIVWDGDVSTFNQQYYMGYFGLQFRGKLEFESERLPTIAWTLQGDGGFTGAYNREHYLIGDDDWYAMDTTHGGCWHVALTAEALFCRERLSVGFQADYLGISTFGKHHILSIPDGIDETWSNGVSVWSRQTWLTAFFKVRF